VVALAIWMITTGASRPTLAGSAAQAGDNFLYMPYVERPAGPPQIEMTPFVAGFDGITIMDIAHAGDERLFIANREGKVWIVYPDGTIEPTPFLDMTKEVQHEVNFEQGFLGLAFHPDFPDTPTFYFAYTSPAHIQIVRGAVDPAHPNVADRNSLRTLMSIQKPQASGGPSPVHNAGDLTFGPDGYLYIPLGDGGPDPYDPAGIPGDPNNHAQRRDSLFGSILRIDPDPAEGRPPDCGLSGAPYSIPFDNPWLDDNGCDEIWAKGLRNPWRIAIDPLNSDFYIADVGEWHNEEVNFYPGGMLGGANFGWHCWEGTLDYTTVHPSLADDCGGDTTFTFPIHEYDHSQGECSIIGGRVYRGSQYPRLYGRYFFGDWCSGRLWTMVREGGQWRVDPAGRLPINFSTFGEDVNGELYGAGYGTGILYKISVD
jgi:glucose/arabinose dehydrogenase